MTLAPARNAIEFAIPVPSNFQTLAQHAILLVPSAVPVVSLITY
jgi:hypothetical protein